MWKRPQGQMMADDWWDRAAVIIQGGGAVGLVVTLLLTNCQIQQARQALVATTAYNVEKDYTDLFKPVETEGFQKCFGARTNPPKDKAGTPPPIVSPDPCGNVAEREHLFNLLVYYRLLLDLEEQHALEATFVSRRFKNACGFIASKGATDTIAEFAKAGGVDARLANRIKKECVP